jgi:hypothetical protein
LPLGDWKVPTNLQSIFATPSEPLKLAAPEELTLPVPWPGCVTVMAPFATENATDPAEGAPA